MVVPAGTKTCQFRIVNEVPQALSLLVDHYFNFVVVDNRGQPGKGRCYQETLAQDFMERVHYSGDPERMYPLARVICVLGEDPCLAEQAFELGRLKVGGFVTRPFEGALFEKMSTAAGRGSAPGKTAICLSGGGVEGFLFEVGVLKALNAHLQSRSVTDFDIFCGISAGSILASLLANGTEPEYVSAALTGDKSLNVDAFTPGIVFDPDIREYLKRVLQLARKLPLLNPYESISALLKTVPVGFAAVPPSGPAMPVMPTPHVVRACVRAATASSRATGSDTAPCAARIERGTASARSFRSFE